MCTGWADPSLAVENALAAEAAGVSALAMHGRTREQMYTGHADLETLHKVAQALTKIPFIANGDIRTVQEAKQRIEEVGADAVMMAALPWEILTSSTKSIITLKQEKSYLI